jgi:FAD/FMN-containing dehydrogenase
MSDFAALSIEGRVATPADSDWDDARRAWNLVVDQHPSAVAFVESAADVSTVVRFAGDRGWAGDGGYFNFAEPQPTSKTSSHRTPSRCCAR